MGLHVQLMYPLITQFHEVCEELLHREMRPVELRCLYLHSCRDGKGTRA